MDQRDIQAAIKSCKDRIKSITAVPDYQPGKRQRKRAIELERLKIAALTPPTQEQIERVWGARWVEKHRHVGGFRRYTGIDDEGERHTITVDQRVEYDDRYCSECGKQSADNFLNFCPYCGRAMTPEAMEIVRKRLEAMDNGETD